MNPPPNSRSPANRETNQSRTGRAAQLGERRIVARQGGSAASRTCRACPAGNRAPSVPAERRAIPVRSVDGPHRKAEGPAASPRFEAQDPPAVSAESSVSRAEPASRRRAFAEAATPAFRESAQPARPGAASRPAEECSLRVGPAHESQWVDRSAPEMDGELAGFAGNQIGSDGIGGLTRGRESDARGQYERFVTRWDDGRDNALDGRVGGKQSGVGGNGRPSQYQESEPREFAPQAFHTDTPSCQRSRWVTRMPLSSDFGRMVLEPANFLESTCCGFRANITQLPHLGQVCERAKAGLTLG